MVGRKNNKKHLHKLHGVGFYQKQTETRNIAQLNFFNEPNLQLVLYSFELVLQSTGLNVISSRLTFLNNVITLECLRCSKKSFKVKYKKFIIGVRS